MTGMKRASDLSQHLPKTVAGSLAAFAQAKQNSTDIREKVWQEVADARARCFVGDVVSLLDVTWHAEEKGVDD